MFVLKLLGLLVSTAAIGTADASTVSRIHLKFVQPPHIQEHTITTDGARILAQQSYLSIGRRQPLVTTGLVNHSFRPRLIGYYPSTQFVAQPRFISQGTAYAPIEQNELHYGTRENNHVTPDFSDGLAYPDPYLLTGDAALLAVRYIYGRGELFFHDIPHVSSLLRNQEERRRNGLNGNILSSIRANSPFRRD